MILLGAITLLAAVLRVWSLDTVPGNPFYDAAVRSMQHSWHNLFFGAFDPAGMLAIDKPPFHLWLQVASVQAFGFGPVALRLPGVVAGIVAVPLLYDAVRRPFGRAAGLVAAAALAVLPVSVVTARSDTMDSLMMALLVLALWLVVRAVESRRDGWLIAAAVVLGVAFNVKLFEALVPLPALVVLARVGLGGRSQALARCAAAFLVTACSWTTVAWLLPGTHPWPIGSATGSVWDSVIRFNGADRLGASASAAGLGGPAFGRLFGGDAAALIGTELVAALVLGGLAVALLRRTDAQLTPLARASITGLATWLITGLVLFSAIGHLEARYLESLSPAVAAALGAATAVLLGPGGRVAGIAITACAVAGIALAGDAAWASVVALVACLAVAAAARTGRVPALAAAVALLAVPAAGAVSAVRADASDAGHSGVLPTWQVELLSRFLTARQGDARYEAVAYNTFSASNLIARDGRPVLVLTSYAGREFTSIAQLEATVRRGDVRYALLSSGPCLAPGARTPACAPVVRWARAHGRDISREIGLGTGGVLFDLRHQPVDGRRAPSRGASGRTRRSRPPRRPQPRSWTPARRPSRSAPSSSRVPTRR